MMIGYKFEAARINKTMQERSHNPDTHDAVVTHLEPEYWNVKSSGL